MPKRTEMALPVPTKAFLQVSLDTYMLFAPFGWHCWKWQWSWKSHDVIWSHWAGKGFKCLPLNAWTIRVHLNSNFIHQFF